VKIVATVRTLNEERNIADFCTAYDWADMVLVADGGSDDDTVKNAEYFPNVWIREFEKRIPINSPPGFMNPEPSHMNFIVKWAEEEGADWIIYNDADERPNPALKRNAREILENTNNPSVFLYRFYMWGTEEYFPKYNTNTTLLAWRPAKLRLKWDDSVDTMFETKIIGLSPGEALHLESPPYCLLHYFATNEEHVQRRLKRYQSWGKNVHHPLHSIYAPPEPLPGWVFEGSI